MADEKPKPQRLRKSASDIPYTQDLGDEICEYIAQGMTLREVCRMPGMPPESTVRLWALDDRYGFSAQYARARSLLLEYWADEMVDIADDGSEDKYEGRNGQTLTNHEVVNRSRLRIDTRKWLLSKLRPDRYGDLISVNTTDRAVAVGAPISQDEALEKLAEGPNGPKPD